jgi:hypothetical protein
MRVWLRVWQEIDLKDVEKHLVVIGQLSGECFNCHQIGLDKSLLICPNCNTKFKYIGFRTKVDPSLVAKLKEKYPYITFIDFDDFKRASSKKAARKILDI